MQVYQHSKLIWFIPVISTFSSLPIFYFPLYHFWRQHTFQGFFLAPRKVVSTHSNSNIEWVAQGQNCNNMKIKSKYCNRSNIIFYHHHHRNRRITAHIHDPCFSWGYHGIKIHNKNIPFLSYQDPCLIPLSFFAYLEQKKSLAEFFLCLCDCECNPCPPRRHHQQEKSGQKSILTTRRYMTSSLYIFFFSLSFVS